MSLFHTDATFVGSATTEYYSGRDEIERFYSMLTQAGIRVALRLDYSVVHNGGDFDWFLAQGEMRVRLPDSREESYPYRISGITHERDGAWALALFHGSRPR
jgi:ketosteroid isomerase-like protein